MANIDLKKNSVKKISEQFSDSEALIISEYKGLNVEQITNLRDKVRQGGFSSTVIKNRLFALSSKSIGLDIPIRNGYFAILFIDASRTRGLVIPSNVRDPIIFKGRVLISDSLDLNNISG
mgnify:CR=1 FL=1